MPCCKHVAPAEARTIMVKTTPPVRWKGLRVSDERAKPCMRRAKKRAAAEGINQPRRGPAFLREDDQQEHEGNVFGEVVQFLGQRSRRKVPDFARRLFYSYRGLGSYLPVHSRLGRRRIGEEPGARSHGIRT